MTWQEDMQRRSHVSRFDEFDLVYQVSLHPAIPEEWRLDDMVALTFRLGRRRDGALILATNLDIAAVARIGTRLGLDEAGSLAMVDSHERVHVQLQLEGVAEDLEEQASRLVDAVWLSLRHPRAKVAGDGDLHVVSRVGHDFWEALVDVG